MKLYVVVEADKNIDPAHRYSALLTQLGQLLDRAEKAEAEAQKWKIEYVEETSYLRKRAERAEDIAKSVRTGAPLYDMLEQRNAAIVRAENAEAEVERLRKGIAAVSALIADIQI